MKRDRFLLYVLRYWHGMTEAEWRRYQGMLDRGEKLNAIEQAEANAVIARVQAWEREQGHVHGV